MFRAVQAALGDELPIIAEDLGIITPEVDALRTRFGFPGMKVLQFAFESTGESDYLPHRYKDPNCVCYTGTHDNDTTLGWFLNLSKECRDKVLRYTRCIDPAGLGIDMIRAALGSIAGYAVFPLQDALGFGSHARMNTPGVAAGNWNWRFREAALQDELAEALREISILYGRY